MSFSFSFYSAFFFLGNFSPNSKFIKFHAAFHQFSLDDFRPKKKTFLPSPSPDFWSSLKMPLPLDFFWWINFNRLAIAWHSNNWILLENFLRIFLSTFSTFSWFKSCRFWCVTTEEGIPKGKMVRLDYSDQRISFQQFVIICYCNFLLVLLSLLDISFFLNILFVLCFNWIHVMEEFEMPLSCYFLFSFIFNIFSCVCIMFCRSSIEHKIKIVGENHKKTQLKNFCDFSTHSLSLLDQILQLFFLLQVLHFFHIIETF